MLNFIDSEDGLEGMKTGEAISWAIPVHPVRLIAHLEAYRQTKSALFNFRLCHRFGRGDTVHLRTIPNELATAIEEFVLGPIREESFEFWSKYFRCFEAGCSLDDHIDDDSDYVENTLDELRELYPEKSEAELKSELVHELLSDGGYETHRSNQDEWSLKLREEGFHPGFVQESKHVGGSGIFQKILLEDFGTVAELNNHLITLQNVKLLQPKFGYYDYNDRPKTIVAFLTIAPGMNSVEFNADDGQSEQGTEFASVMCNLVDIDALVSQKQHNARLLFAMKALGLRPFVSPIICTQFGLLSPPVDTLLSQNAKDGTVRMSKETLEPRIKKLKQSSWPKLLQIVAVRYAQSPYG